MAEREVRRVTLDSLAARKKKATGDPVTSHPTRNLIIETVATIMKKKGVHALHIDDVLEATEVTRGAIHHHFENVDDLIECALLAVYAEDVEFNVNFVRSTLGSATNLDEFRRGVFEANEIYANNETLKSVRVLRAHAIAASGAGGDFADGLALEQQRLTAEYVAVIANAKSRGWVRDSVDPLSLAVFIQAYSFGDIVDDVSRDHVGPKAWPDIIESFFEGSVFPAPRGSRN